MVVFPAPFGPSSAHTSPYPTRRSTPATATTEPYDLASPFTTIAAESSTSHSPRLSTLGGDKHSSRRTRRYDLIAPTIGGRIAGLARKTRRRTALRYDDRRDHDEHRP